MGSASSIPTLNEEGIRKLYTSMEDAPDSLLSQDRFVAAVRDYQEMLHEESVDNVLRFERFSADYVSTYLQAKNWDESEIFQDFYRNKSSIFKG